MECVEPQWAERLHGAPFNSYSQYCVVEGSSLVWVVNALTGEAHEAIVERLLNAADLRIKKLDLPLAFGAPCRDELSRRDLVDMVYTGDAQRFTLRFVSPAAFKSGGAYQNIPNMRLVYQNLLMHYGQVFDADHEADAGTVDYLVSRTRIVRYSLRSQGFALSGKNIPAFMGTMTVKVEGPQPLKGLAGMLFHFGRFAGIGIKTSMGMGGLLVE
ncbi:hypothetical protein B5F40_02720 [Gordonibacter sp. An230]|uniref:CRISPR system precrRNA processing endoribonuclease RAMP protein Cas6 n=1 Tax=Gordonibacter sp. An230 TaxID=1965592 RepID=UPI000B3A7FED|nr:CRISPR system precrRNA processing endoribonuclease RAMP protein Cas6 [Gordonibacter sp. An230]OUO91767.1 hypothetical protein B5F40_02720 [Gordonibacter sp. An230]